MKTKLVVLNPGYGGSDTGPVFPAQGKPSARGSDITRGIISKLHDKIIEDKRLFGKTSYSMAGKDISSDWGIKERKETIFKFHDAPIHKRIDLILSVEISNAIWENAPSGLVVHFKGNYREAKIMYGEIIAAGSARGYILEGNQHYRITECPRQELLDSGTPFLLVKTGFISNAYDRMVLTSDRGQETFAIGMANGLYKIFNA